MGLLSRIAPLAAGIWRIAPNWLRGAVTWMINGKVLVGVSGVLLNDENQVLLLRHRFHNTRIWGLPGGWLSPGETVFDCWRREVQEELALGISVEAIICQRAFRRTLEFYLLGRIGGGELKIDPVEILEARYFPTDKLPPMEPFGAQVIRQALLHADGRMTKGTGGGPGQAQTDRSGEMAGQGDHSSGREAPVEASREGGDALRA